MIGIGGFTASEFGVEGLIDVLRLLSQVVGASIG